ncbi:MAG: NAD(P)/FAD-dependent oxidoreductase, partial [Proteobacteria bacterium]|nr:NAD(P)/FAD-dependent oxidoreductase [Pseudomonadota bacterium]
VLVVEAKGHVGERCHCAEWVPLLLPREVSLPPSAHGTRSEHLTVHLADKQAPVKAPGLSIDRPRWERHLLLRATRAGAVVQAGVRFKGLKNGRALIEGPFGRAVVTTRTIVAADGAVSRVAQAAGLTRLDTVGAVQVEADLTTEVPGGLVAFRPDLIGYTWLFPKGETANVGLGGRPLGEVNLSRMLDQWRSTLNDWGLIGQSVLRRMGGRLPVAGPRPGLALGVNGTTVLLAGDAAGLTHPATGAGIPQATASGTLAGRAAGRIAAGDQSAGAAYDREVRDRFGGYLERGRARREKAGAMWADDFEHAVRTYWPLWPKKDAWKT